MKSASVESVVQLLRYCEEFAKKMLATSGEFYPFGAFINLDEKIKPLNAETQWSRERYVSSIKYGGNKRSALRRMGY